MSQVYDSNARTNQHIREIIQKSDLTNIELSQIYNINVKTNISALKSPPAPQLRYLMTI